MDQFTTAVARTVAQRNDYYLQIVGCTVPLPSVYCIEYIDGSDCTRWLLEHFSAFSTFCDCEVFEKLSRRRKKVSYYNVVLCIYNSKTCILRNYRPYACTLV